MRRPRLGNGLLDPQRQDRLLRLARDRHLAVDVVAFVAAIGEDQEERPAVIDGVRYLVVKASGADVAGGDPALDSAPLEELDDFHGGHAILRHVAHEE